MECNSIEKFHIGQGEAERLTNVIELGSSFLESKLEYAVQFCTASSEWHTAAKDRERERERDS